MGRKAGASAFKRPKLDIPKNHHFIYSPEGTSSDATVVRYLGDQDGDFLWCYHPEKFAAWFHVSHLSNVPKHAKAA